jgi:Alw26I/Eco31I/Esp3I family type II restriction m6 adenine DNA methyltransferase
LVRATGKFYTHQKIAKHLIAAIAGNLPDRDIALIDPFAGDGRLITAFLSAAGAAGYKHQIRVVVWDRDAESLAIARRSIRNCANKLRLAVELSARTANTFRIAPHFFDQFNVVITNPPWEMLKPDRRELEVLSDKSRKEYIESLRREDEFLSRCYPYSQPKMKFSGWGTNLARVGTEIALRLTVKNGICGLVSPSSLLADQMSQSLRELLFTDFELADLAYFPAEARLFEHVDQAAITLVGLKRKRHCFRTRISLYGANGQRRLSRFRSIRPSDLRHDGFCLPLQLGPDSFTIIRKLRAFPRFGDLESNGLALWAGRELDETAHEAFLAARGKYRFVKGQMIRRFGLVEKPTRFVSPSGPKIPGTASFRRLAWRDVSRPNQIRRLHATLIPKYWVTGNSLNVAFFRDGNQRRLKALLSVMNSYVFEVQVRALLATAHVSLGAVRRAHVPDLQSDRTVKTLARWADRCLSGDEKAVTDFEIAVARAYGLDRKSFHQILKLFALPEDTVERLLTSPAWSS